MFREVSDSVFMITEEDMDLDLFESRFPTPEGVTYNSYVIIDEKIAVLDTIDERRSEEWMNDLEKILGGKKIDYLVIHHMEPDHSANIKRLAERYPEMKIVGNTKIFKMVGQFFGDDYSDRQINMDEGSVLELGKHSLRFINAPMVHWPEVMFSYDESSGLIFTADAFGRFGPASEEFDWAEGARRYYYNIVGKFGAQAAKALAKAATLKISMICPLHGPVLSGDLSEYMGYYTKWANYEPELDGVFIAYTSVYGNTKKAAFALGEELVARGVSVKITDVARTHDSYCLEDAFRFSKLALITTTYENEIFPEMRNFVLELISKKFCNRKVALIDNGSWGPSAAKQIGEMISGLSGIEILEPRISLKSAMNSGDMDAIKALADRLSAQ